MEIEQVGPDEAPDLVVIFGWGNRLDHDNVRWFVDQCVDAGYRVHAVELPVVFEDFYEDLLVPVEALVDSLDSFRLVGHSTGGLIAPYVEGAETETYLSPWWGYRESDLPGGDTVLSLVSRIPVSRPVVPKGRWGRAELGALATDQQIEDNPDLISPTVIREARLAQRNRPPIADDAVVFCTLQDAIVSLSAIGTGVPATRTVVYDGGHELFSSPDREAFLDVVLSVIDVGAAGMEAAQTDR